MVDGLSKADAAADSEARLFEDIRSFVLSYWLVVPLAAVAMVFAYGLAITTFALSVDEEMDVLDDSLGSWASQGRPVVLLVRALFDQGVALPVFSPLFSLLLLWLAASIWGCLFLRAAGRIGRHRVALLVFLVVATTLPVNSHYLMWGAFDIAVSVGLVLASLSAWCSWLWAVEGWRTTYAVLSVVLAISSMLIYQSLVGVALTGVLIAQLAYLLGYQDGRTASAIRQASWRSTARLAAPIVLAALVGIGVLLQLIRAGSYTSGFLRWGSETPDVIVAGLLKQVGSYLLGQGFSGGWVMLPTLAVVFVLALVMIRRSFRGGGWWPLALLVAILLLPFANSVALGAPLPTRAMLVVPLVGGSVWLLLAIALPASRALTAVLVLGAITLTVWHGSVNHRLFMTERVTYEVDRSVAQRVIERLAAIGWDGGTVPVVSVGPRPLTALEADGASEEFGVPIFNVDGGARTPAFFMAMGHPVRPGTPEEVVWARQRAATMPDWPATGSVVFEDGVVFVRFAQP